MLKNVKSYKRNVKYEFLHVKLLNSEYTFEISNPFHKQ